MVNKNSGLCNFCIEKVDIIQVFLLPFLPILLIYSAFLPKLAGSGRHVHYCWWYSYVTEVCCSLIPPGGRQVCFICGKCMLL